MHVVTSYSVLEIINYFVIIRIHWHLHVGQTNKLFCNYSNTLLSSCGTNKQINSNTLLSSCGTSKQICMHEDNNVIAYFYACMHASRHMVVCRAVQENGACVHNVSILK